MLKYSTLLLLFVALLGACEKKSEKSQSEKTTDTTTAAQLVESAAHPPCSTGPVRFIISPGTTGDVNRLTPDAAYRRYEQYKAKVLRKDPIIEPFCVNGSGSRYKILKCGHFPAGIITDHICLDEASLKAIWPTYDGVRLYPIQKGSSGADAGRVHFLLTFTSKGPDPTGGTTEVYNDNPAAPILLLKFDWLKTRICAIGTHTERVIMTAHRLCTPNCPEDENGELLFDY